jgi:hypothetical protein
VRRYFLVLSILFALISVPGTIVRAIEYGGLGGVPANPDPNNPRTSSIFVYTLSPGENKKDAVKVVNNTNESKTVEVYAADSELASGGSFACAQKSDSQENVGAWIELDKTETTLEANSEEIIGFRLRVPTNASVGEHNGCLVIQEKGTSTDASGNGVQLSFRSALRTVVTVPGEIVKDAEFSELSVDGQDKKYIITAKLYNKGNVSLDTDVAVIIKDLLGRKVYQNGGVYPLLSQKQPIELNFEYPRPFWGGLYRITGTASYNGDPNATLGTNNEKDVTKHAPSSVLFVMPHPLATLIILLIIILLLTLVWYIWRKWYRRRKIAASWRPYRIQAGDTIVGLARQRRVGWKTVAQVNKLRPPYELKPGTTIKLPYAHTKKR